MENFPVTDFAKTSKKRAGGYQVIFSAVGGSASGGDASKLPSGVYFYRLTAGGFVATKKLVVVK